MEPLSQAFKIYLQQLGYSKSSCYMLPECISAFLRHHRISGAVQINQEHIQAFYAHLQSRPHKRKDQLLSESYIHHHVYALKLFCNWLEQTKQIKINPISNLDFPQPSSPQRQPLNQEEIKSLFAATASYTEISLLHLFYSCGLRRSEAVQLNTTDIHFNQNLLYIRNGKGAKRRVIPLTEKVKAELLHYYQTERTTTKQKDSEAFMLNSRGNRMSGNHYNQQLKQIVARAELNKDISLHHLRHSIATHLLENGLSIELVRDFLGHSLLETTQIYTTLNQHQILRI